MIPIPSKHPFGHPVHPEALAYFVHPTDPNFGKPFLCAGKVCTNNRWLAVIWDYMPTDGIEEDPGAENQFLTVPWDLLERKHDGPWWKPLDRLSSLFRYGAKDIWWTDPQGRAWLNDRTIVEIGTGGGAALPLLQLIARLPRLHLNAWVGETSPIPFHFNGGRGILAPIPDFAAGRIRKAFTILRPGRDHFGDLIWGPRPEPKPYIPKTPPAKPTWPPQDLNPDDLPVTTYD
jgi:hypothetical protein